MANPTSAQLAPLQEAAEQLYLLTEHVSADDLVNLVTQLLAGRPDIGYDELDRLHSQCSRVLTEERRQRAIITAPAN